MVASLWQSHCDVAGGARQNHMRDIGGRGGTRKMILTGLAGGALNVAPGPAQQAKPAPASYVPGEFLVKSQPRASATRGAAAVASSGGQVLRRFDRVDIDHVRLSPGIPVPAAIAALQSNP